jgi:hypothetical protein
MMPPGYIPPGYRPPKSWGGNGRAAGRSFKGCLGMCAAIIVSTAIMAGLVVLLHLAYH